MCQVDPDACTSLSGGAGHEQPPWRPSTTRLGLSTRHSRSPLCGVDGPAVTTPDRRLQQGNDQTYPDPDVDTYDSQPTRLNQDWRAIVDRHVRAGQAEVSRVAKLEQAQALNAVGKLAEAEVPLPFATPPGAALAS